MTGRHLILIGFMGTGKSVVGRLLGDKTALPVTDTDAEVAREAGISIPEIFRREGEEGFRARERRVLERVVEESPRIVTTGGGIVLHPENVRLLRESGWVAALDASAEELVRRLETDRSRPLLAGDAKEKISRLKRERRGLYDFAHFRWDTTHCSPEETAEAIWQEWKRLFPPGDGGHG